MYPCCRNSQVKEKKTLTIICLNTEDLESILHEAAIPFQAWISLKNLLEPLSRARIASVKKKFIDIKFDPLT